MTKFFSAIFNVADKENILDALVRSSIISIVARGFGYLKHIAIAVLLGFSIQTDAFFMALSLIGIFLIFADVFDSIGVPNLVKARLENQEEFERLTGLLFSFTLFLIFTVGFLSVVSLPFILKIPVGFKAKAVTYTKLSYFLLMPYLLLSFLFHHFGAILRSVRRFTPYFIGEFIFSFVTFLFTVTGLALFKSWIVLPISLSLAQVVATIYMLYVGREFIHLSLFFNQTTKKLLKHFFFLSALYGVFHLFVVVDRAFASLLGEKSISSLYYGLTIASIPRVILRLEHMAITSLSETRGSLSKLNFYVKKVLIFSIPIIFIFFFLSKIIVKLLFGYGAFSKTDVTLTAEATKYYSLSIPLMFLWPLFYRVFQIKENLKPVFFVAVAGVVVNALLNYFLVVVYELGIMGICLGTFGAYLLICGFSYLILYLGDKSYEK
ncbi:putative peptidoglycan lipid II flippase [Balnearium lithotrophicum]|uniref:Putative peptidoglycan lipid II flippase n=1 Tax=Balnearium lithotrophicum TaxID=223788 RepID=A0A521C738_9BACT|nr:lipid II flippase MurJ [Balnearium lithotrophicum]SMO55236.1 putative peptidoglycan lipid II flippase [Balnearium lithotrophicum]